MKNLSVKHVRFLKEALLLNNALLVIYNASLFLLSTSYISINNYSRSFLEKVSYVPSSPQGIFFESILMFVILVVFTILREKEYFKELNGLIVYVEIFLALLIIIKLNGTYNGVLLFVFADILYNTKNIKHWPIILIIAFGLLLISDFNILSIFIHMPSIDSYLEFYPLATKTLMLFGKNILTSLNVVTFILFLVSNLFLQQIKTEKISEELKLVSKVNDELRDYSALSEKMAEDKERKRISREIHDTLGHALTGISAGIDACITLIDIDSQKAKQQLQVVSNVVRVGIKDVRRSLYKLRPDALEDRSLKDALNKMIEEFESVSHLEINLYYEWDNIDIENTKEDIIYRIVQETVTNALRHGHANKVDIDFFVSDGNFLIVMQDNGQGCSDIKYGYGLKQMSERVNILGGTIHFLNQDGFRTIIEINNLGGKVND